MEMSGSLICTGFVIKTIVIISSASFFLILMTVNFASLVLILDCSSVVRMDSRPDSKGLIKSSGFIKFVPIISNFPFALFVITPVVYNRPNSINIASQLNPEFLMK